MAAIVFNAATVPPQQSFDALPRGRYLALIIESKIKATKSATGQYLQLTWEILEPEQFKGRRIWDRLNIANANKTAEDIAQRALSAICHATEVMDLQDSDQLHGIPVLIDVAIEERDGYDPTNRIKSYAAAVGASAPNQRTPVVPPAAARQAAKPAAVAARAPWRK